MKKAMLVLSLALSVFAFTPVQADEINTGNDFSYNEANMPEYDYDLFQRFGRQMYLGQVYLGITRSQVSLNTNTCAVRGGRIDAVRFQVLNAGADIDAIHVQFGNGRWQSFNLGHRNFRPGQTSQWLNLRGMNDRCVRRIVVIGDTDNEFFFTRAVVRFWAR